MIKITRQTRQGWKTYIYETKKAMAVGRPWKVLNANLLEIQTPNVIKEEDDGMYRVHYKNKGKSEKTPPKTHDEAKKSAKFLKAQGATSIKIIKEAEVKAEVDTETGYESGVPKDEKKKKKKGVGEKEIKGKGKVMTAPAGAYGNEDEKLLDTLDQLAEEYLVEKKWEGPLPKGWTPESREKFAKSLTGKAKESPEGFTRECISKMEGKVEDAGAFCASLKDRYVGTTKWRGEESEEMLTTDKIKKIMVEQEEKEKAVKTSENEGGAKDKWTIADFQDQIEEWGFDDKKKLQGMIDKATEIAKKSTESAPGKATRAEVLGIMQGFMKKKG